MAGRSVCFGSSTTTAFSAASSTCTERTPGSAASAWCTCWVHWAQSMPVMGTSRVFRLGAIALSVTDVVQPLPVQGGHVVVVEAVEHLPTVLAGPHQAHLPQPAHVVRHGRLADGGGLGQRADVQLAGCQRRDDAHAAG